MDGCHPRHSRRWYRGTVSGKGVYGCHRVPVEDVEMASRKRESGSTPRFTLRFLIGSWLKPTLNP